MFWGGGGNVIPSPSKKPLKKKKVKKKKVMIIASGLGGRTQKERWKSVAWVGVGGGGWGVLSAPSPKGKLSVKIGTLA